MKYNQIIICALFLSIQGCVNDDSTIQAKVITKTIIVHDTVFVEQFMKVKIDSLEKTKVILNEENPSGKSKSELYYEASKAIFEGSSPLSNAAKLSRDIKSPVVDTYQKF